MHARRLADVECRNLTIYRSGLHLYDVRDFVFMMHIFIHTPSFDPALLAPLLRSPCLPFLRML